MDEVAAELGETMFVPYLENYACIFDTILPPHLSKDIRNYHKHNMQVQFPVTCWLVDKRYLRYPTEEEAMRLCTVMWCK